MAKRSTEPKFATEHSLDKPWPLIIGILFGLLCAMTVFFLAYGLSPEIDSHLLGTLDISMIKDSKGQVILYPKPGMTAEQAGVQNFDVLVKIDGKPVNRAESLSPQVSGRIGTSVTITVRKQDGKLKDYTLIRSPGTQTTLSNAGFTPISLTIYLVTLSLLVGLGFLVMAGLLLLRRPTDIACIIGAFVLLLIPYNLNTAGVLFKGFGRANLVLLYNAWQVIGFFMVSFLLLIFPNGKFVPKWSRWLLIPIGIWMIFYYFVTKYNVSILPGVRIFFVWVIIFATGLIFQLYRFRSISTDRERRKTRPVAWAMLIGLVIYLVVWFAGYLLPTTMISDTGMFWYYLISELVVDAALVYLGSRLLLSLRKSE